jgi:hypothetical protein
MSKPRPTTPIRTPRELWESFNKKPTGILSIKDAVDAAIKKPAKQ